MHATSICTHQYNRLFLAAFDDVIYCWCQERETHANKAATPIAGACMSVFACLCLHVSLGVSMCVG